MTGSQGSGSTGNGGPSAPIRDVEVRLVPDEITVALYPQRQDRYEEDVQHIDGLLLQGQSNRVAPDAVVVPEGNESPLPVIHAVDDQHLNPLLRRGHG